MKHKKQKHKEYTDECGKIHIVIEPTNARNEMHFQHQLNTRMQIVESRKYKKPKHKKKVFEEE